VQRDHQERDPLLPFQLFRNKVFSLSIVLASTVMFAGIAMILTLTNYLQSVLGMPAVTVGVVLAVLSLVFSPIAGNLVPARRHRCWPARRSRMIWQPDAVSSAICCNVALTSAVNVAVMDYTKAGASPTTGTEPTVIFRFLRRLASCRSAIAGMLKIAIPRNRATLRRSLLQALDVTDGPTMLRIPKGTWDPI